MLIITRFTNNELLGYVCFNLLFINSLYFIFKSFKTKQFKGKLVFLSFFLLSSCFILLDCISVVAYIHGFTLINSKTLSYLGCAIPLVFLLLCLGKRHVTGSSTPHEGTYNLCYKRACSNKCLKAIFFWPVLFFTHNILAETCKIYDGTYYHGYNTATGLWRGFEHNHNHVYIDTGVKVTPARNEHLRKYHGEKFAYRKNCLILSKKIIKEMRKL